MNIIRKSEYPQYFIGGQSWSYETEIIRSFVENDEWEITIIFEISYNDRKYWINLSDEEFKEIVGLWRTNTFSSYYYDGFQLKEDHDIDTYVRIRKEVEIREIYKYVDLV